MKDLQQFFSKKELTLQLIEISKQKSFENNVNFHRIIPACCLCPAFF